MTSRFKDTSLILAVILCGTLVGAFAYSSFTFYSVYISPMHPAPMVVTGAEGFQGEIFWMFMHPVVVLSLFVTLILNWKDGARRPLILVSILVYCLALSATRLFFLHNLIAYIAHNSNSAVPKWLLRGMEWQQFGWMRAALMYIAEISLLIAMMRSRPVAGPQPTIAAQPAH